ncbi:phosphatase PAP2 family protein [Pedobacter changchengzhani]|nr:phosphatase PAP2 family protein [Pedobacter changchengzhani]
MKQNKYNLENNISRSKYVPYILLLASICFVLITTLVVIFPSNAIDIGFTLMIQHYQSAFLDKFMTAISVFGHIKISVPMVLATAIIFLLFKKKKESLFIVFTAAAGIVSSLVKYFVNRPRPPKSIVRLIEVTHQQSFPSGHVLFYTVFFGFILYLMFKLKDASFYLRLVVSSICVLMIVLVFFSRIYLGAHWLSDVLASYFLGILCLYVLIYFYELKNYKI